ncbi:MAG: hypothetical protein AAF460_06155, partial [Pseudomonadota bacterium]
RSNLAKLLPRAARFRTTIADQKQLHPKISWQTFHRGVPDTEHGYYEYNQSVSATGKPRPNLWELAHRAGKRVGVGASIGSFPLPDDVDNYAFYLPDPFAPSETTVPALLEHFQRFNHAAVKHSSRNVRRGGTRRAEALAFLRRLPALGVSTTTVLKVAAQLLGERINAARMVRRRNIQALMSFDVVFKQISASRPDVTTVFINHVAAAMHRYWAAKFVDDYDSNNMPEAWRDTYANEIDQAMLETDYMLGRLRAFVRSNPEYSVTVVSSMGQAAIEHEVTRNQLVITDMAAYLGCLGFARDDYTQRAGMEPEYVIAFKDTESQRRFCERSASVDINGEAPYVKCHNATEVTLQVFQNNVAFDHITVGDRPVPLTEAGLAIEPIQDLAGSTAQHVREGCCFVFDGANDLSVHSNEGQCEDIGRVTATLLSVLGVDLPAYLPEPIPALARALEQGVANPFGRTERGRQAGSRSRAATDA